MEQHNPSAHNTENNQQNNQQRNQQNNSQQRFNNQNSRPQSDRNRSQDRRGQQDRNSNQDRSRLDKNHAGEKGINPNNDRTRAQSDSKYPQKPKEQKAVDRPRSEQAGKTQSQPNKSQASQNHGAGSNNNNRYARNPLHNVTLGDTAARHIIPKRIETVEDIQADIERVEKDIQFEIKQIRAVKLGL